VELLLAGEDAVGAVEVEVRLRPAKQAPRRTRRELREEQALVRRTRNRIPLRRLRHRTFRRSWPPPLKC